MLYTKVLIVVYQIEILTPRKPFIHAGLRVFALWKIIINSIYLRVYKLIEKIDEVQILYARENENI